MLTIFGNIFTAFIGEEPQRTKPEVNQLFVKWIEFTEGGNVEQRVIEEYDVTFKGTPGRDQAAQQTGSLGSGNLKAREPLTNGLLSMGEGGWQ